MKGWRGWGHAAEPELLTRHAEPNGVSVAPNSLGDSEARPGSVSSDDARAPFLHTSLFEPVAARRPSTAPDRGVPRPGARPWPSPRARHETRRASPWVAPYVVELELESEVLVELCRGSRALRGRPRHAPSHGRRCGCATPGEREPDARGSTRPAAALVPGERER